MRWLAQKPVVFRIVQRANQAIILLCLFFLVRVLFRVWRRDPSGLVPIGIALATCLILGVIACLVIDAIRNVVGDFKRARPEVRGFEIVMPTSDTEKSVDDNLPPSSN